MLFGQRADTAVNSEYRWAGSRSFLRTSKYCESQRADSNDGETRVYAGITIHKQSMNEDRSSSRSGISEPDGTDVSCGLSGDGATTQL